MNLKDLAINFIKEKQSLGYKYKTDSIVIKEIINYFKENNIFIITKEVIDAYVKHNPNWKPATLARNICVLKEFCLYLKKQGLESYQIPDKRFKIKIPKYISYIFSHKEIDEIMNNLDILTYHNSYYDKCAYPIILKILYQTGMRVGEVINLKVNDYIKEEGCFYLKNTKNYNERLIYLPNKLNEEISNYLQKFHYKLNNNQYLFISKRQGKISCLSIEKYFYKVLIKVGIKRKESGPRLHDLRHTFIVHTIEKWQQEGKNINAYLPILQVYVGHQSIKSLEYYFKITQNIISNINKISEEKLGYLIPTLCEVDDYE